MDGMADNHKVCMNVLLSQCSSHVSSQTDTTVSRTDARRPQKELDIRLWPFNWQLKFNMKDRRAPVLHFGLPYEWKNVEFCLKKNNITSRWGFPLKDRPSPDGSFIVETGAVVDFLRHKLDIHLSRELGIAEDGSVRLILALYNNYDAVMHRYVAEDQNEIVAAIQDELDLQDQEPKWWWSAWWSVEWCVHQFSPAVCLRLTGTIQLHL